MWLLLLFLLFLLLLFILLLLLLFLLLAATPRVVETAKGELLKFLPDVYIYTDHFTGPRSGKSPGFGLTLTAETTTGCFLTAEVVTTSCCIVLLNFTWFLPSTFHLIPTFPGVQ